MNFKRSYWHSNHLGIDYEADDPEVRVPAPKEQANLIGSLVEGDQWGPTDDGAMHLPALDIDHMCHLRESETPGHFHLLIDKPMTWAQYKKLLDVMAEVGIVEKGYVRASKERGLTFLARRPWKDGKGNEQAR